MVDKFLLQQLVLQRLADDPRQFEQAVSAAHEAATHEENIAEHKYDTLGLEAAYLATGRCGAQTPSARRWSISGYLARSPIVRTGAYGWARWSVCWVQTRNSSRSF